MYIRWIIVVNKMVIIDIRNNNGRCFYYRLIVNFINIFNYINMLKYFNGLIE